MKHYLVTITLADGSKVRLDGLYAHSVDAILHVLDAFGAVRRVSAVRQAS